MKTVYVARCGARAPRWVASDGERALAGGRGADPARLLGLWSAEQGWPDLVVILPGRYATMADALGARLSDNLRLVSEIVQLAADRLGAWSAKIWDGPDAGPSGAEGKECGMSEPEQVNWDGVSERARAPRPALGVDVFVQIWDCLARYGLADGLGGQEFCRALEDWLADGRPVWVRAWLAAWQAAQVPLVPHPDKLADNLDRRVRDGEEA